MPTVPDFNAALAAQRLRADRRRDRVRAAAATAMLIHGLRVDRRLAALAASPDDIIVPGPAVFTAGLAEEIDGRVGPEVDDIDLDVGLALAGAGWAESGAPQRQARREHLAAYAMAAAGGAQMVLLSLGGETAFQQVREKVRDHFGRWATGGAKWLAGNETAGAINGAAATAAQVVGLDGTKVWQTVGDAHVRPSHRDAGGQEVPVGHPFLVGGESLMYPRDPVGSAAQIERCRCSVEFSDGVAAHREQAILARYGHDPERIETALIDGIANRSRSTAVHHRTDVTRILRDIEDGSAMSLRGLDFSVKGAGSLARKIRERTARKGLTAWQAGEDIHDVLRFTLAGPVGSHTEDVADAIRALERAGYKRVEVENFWQDGNPYKGINSQWDTPDGYRFELQFHTDESFTMKEVVNHPPYERARLDTTPPDEQAALVEQMVRNSAGLDVPSGIDQIGVPAGPGAVLSSADRPGLARGAGAEPVTAPAGLTAEPTESLLGPVYVEGQGSVETVLAGPPIVDGAGSEVTGGRMHEEVMAGLDGIDLVHALPDDLVARAAPFDVVPVIIHALPRGRGKFRRRNATSPSYIALDAQRGDALTMVHEFGHMFDLSDLGAPTGGFSYGHLLGPSVPDDVRIALMRLERAIEDTPEVRTIRTAKREVGLSDDQATVWYTGRAIDGTPVQVRPAEGGLDYYLLPEELFARAYSQWIATEGPRSGRLWDAFVRRRAEVDETWATGQWSDESFGPVQQAFRDLFSALGLTRVA